MESLHAITEEKTFASIESPALSPIIRSKQIEHFCFLESSQRSSRWESYRSSQKFSLWTLSLIQTIQLPHIKIMLQSQGSYLSIVSVSGRHGWFITTKTRVSIICTVQWIFQNQPTQRNSPLNSFLERKSGGSVQRVPLEEGFLWVKFLNTKFRMCIFFTKVRVGVGEFSAL
jgi:hypothetical protein